MGDPDLSAAPWGGPVLLNSRAATRPTITGVERWTVEVVSRLHDSDPGRYQIVAPRPRLRSRARGQAWEQVALPILAAQRRARLILSPANLAPLAWPHNVLVLHDAAVLRQPQAYSAPYQLWHGRAGLAMARRALKVITVSDFSRRELMAVSGLGENRVAVVGGGVSPAFSPRADRQRATTRLGLWRPYVLTVATVDRRKNLSALGETAERLGQLGIDLIRAGDDRPYFTPGKPSPGRSIGYVNDADLPGLYAGALAFVLPSLYEGFGLTCLEAMACGTPVVASDRGALPETCGDAAILVNPQDQEGLARAVLTCVTDAGVRDRLIAAGQRRAEHFTWDRAAELTDRLLCELTGAG